MRIESYHCKKCGWHFDLNMAGACDSDHPLYCPCCGREWEIKKTPAEIVEEIKTIYHISSKYRIVDGESTIHRNENEMERLLNELKVMAEAPKGIPNFIDKK